MTYHLAAEALVLLSDDEGARVYILTLYTDDPALRTSHLCSISHRSKLSVAGNLLVGKELRVECFLDRWAQLSNKVTRAHW